jgi:PPOX class probable F420-dependent enzyme
MAATLDERMRALVDDPNPAVLATLNPDGSPQTTVVWVGRDGDDLLISSTAGLRKERNLRRDPRASLTVLDRADPLRCLVARGTVTVTEDAGRALAARLADKYEGDGAGDGAGAEYLDLPPEVVRVEVVRVVLRLTPDRVSYRDFT